MNEKYMIKNVKIELNQNFTKYQNSTHKTNVLYFRNRIFFYLYYNIHIDYFIRSKY